jgi:outer membrane immunogenic protein
MIKSGFLFPLLFVILLATHLRAAEGTPQTPEFDWNGPYVGLDAGYGWANSRATEDRIPPAYNALGESWSYHPRGFSGDGHLGYNLHSAIFLIGAEADIGYLGLNKSKASPASVAFFGGDTKARTKTDFYASARGRFGLTLLERALIYATGGWIGAHARLSVIDACITGPCGGGLVHAASNRFRSGYVGGVGLEYAVARNWTIKAEALYFSFGSDKVSGIANAGSLQSWKIRTEGGITRLGVNFKF